MNQDHRRPKQDAQRQSSTTQQLKRTALTHSTQYPFDTEGGARRKKSWAQIWRVLAESVAGATGQC
jgi:hypothetical protein